MYREPTLQRNVHVSPVLAIVASGRRRHRRRPVSSFPAGIIPRRGRCCRHAFRSCLRHVTTAGRHRGVPAELGFPRGRSGYRHERLRRRRGRSGEVQRVFANAQRYKRADIKSSRKFQPTASLPPASTLTLPAKIRPTRPSEVMLWMLSASPSITRKGCVVRDVDDVYTPSTELFCKGLKARKRTTTKRKVD